jgi:hypothetical protein
MHTSFFHKSANRRVCQVACGKYFGHFPQKRLGKLQIISIRTDKSGKIVSSLILWQSSPDTAGEHIPVLGVWIDPFSANLLPSSPSQERERHKLEREVRSGSILRHLDLSHLCCDKRSRAPDTSAFPLTPSEESRSKQTSHDVRISIDSKGRALDTIFTERVRRCALIPRVGVLQHH